MAYDGKTNWQNNEIVEAFDLNRIEKGVGTNDANILIHKNDLSNPHQTTKAQVGLDKVDNTADLNKPVSIAQKSALDLKADLDLGNVLNADFLAKAKESGVISDFIPDNKIRFDIVLTTPAGVIASNKNINISVGGVISTTALTDAGGKATAEMDYKTGNVWTFNITSIPEGHVQETIPSISASSVKPGTKVNVGIKIVVIPTVRWTVRRTIGNTNPATALVYTGDAAGFTPSNLAGTTFTEGSWADKFPFNQIKPCHYVSATDIRYLDPNNFNKYADGTTANIDGVGITGDVMIEFPQIFYKVSSDGTYQYFEISNTKLAGFCDYAMRYNDILQTKFWIGAFKGHVSGGKLRSVANVSITMSQSRAQLRTASKQSDAKGGLFSYYRHSLMQILFVIRFKDLNAQSVFASGNTSALKVTGSQRNWGMYAGSNISGSQNMTAKCFGIEDLYGGGREALDGITMIQGKVYTQTSNYSDNISQATLIHTYEASFRRGLMANILAINEAPFLSHGTSLNGSNTTNFCDYFSINGSSTDVYGLCLGYVPNAAVTPNLDDGIFCAHFESDSDIAGNSYTGYRLMIN